MSDLTVDQVVAAVFGDTSDSVKAVDHVFAVLAATYGAGWDRALGAAPIGDVKTAWAHQLGQFTHSIPAKRAIVWALKNLPEFAPSAIAFRNLCRQAPNAVPLALPEPKADPARVATELAKLGAVRAKAAINGMKDWAHRLKARHEAGEKLNPNQIRCFTEALAC